ncbi:2OG-Fe(II) oxygenase [Sphingobacterium mizutaii]|uniref:2OG-Fe(II) oxygenase n=1 Tax=Sphingobacterium mizutaii TaxID=1010 RepID=UPI0028AFDD09|nr:2OG-Fe(II) oxygenase [Sphingobacterium mizutaii]
MNPYLNSHNQDLMDYARKHKAKYKNANPFPSISLENFFNPEFLTEVLEEFPDLSKGNNIVYNDPLQKKLAGNGEELFGPRTKQLMHFLNSEPFLNFVKEITSIEETLFGDPYFSGAGLHETKRGGLLKVHADFNKHPINGLDRRVNLIVYLNKDWKDEYGGHFELWDEEMNGCVDKFAPNFNSIAMFSTTSVSYHGLPNPLTCPEHMSRKSLALYFYSNGRPETEAVAFKDGHNSIFVKRKNSSEDSVAWDRYDEFRRKKPILRRIYNKIVARLL